MSKNNGYELVKRGLRLRETIDKNDIEERFFVSFSQWYAKVFSLKDFYNEIMKEFLIMKNIYLLRRKWKKDTFDIGQIVSKN